MRRKSTTAKDLAELRRLERDEQRYWPCPAWSTPKPGHGTRVCIGSEVREWLTTGRGFHDGRDTWSVGGTPARNSRDFERAIAEHMRQRRSGRVETEYVTRCHVIDWPNRRVPLRLVVESRPRKPIVVRFNHRA